MVGLTTEVEMVAIQQFIDQTEPDMDAGGALDDGSLLRPVPASRTQPHRPTLQLHLLGSPQLGLSDRPIVLRTRKTLALLTYLALQGGQQPREQLADLFWPEADIEDARASLRTTLSYVRQALGADADVFLSATRESIGLLASARIDLDVKALADARQLLRQSPDTGILRRQIEAVVERYRGPFLAGVSLPDAPDFEAWMEGQRTHWRSVEADLLDQLATLQIHDGDTGAALTTLEQWTLVNPDEEAAWERLIETHLQQEDSAGARRAWKRYCEALAELDAEPGPGMAALAERIDGVAPAHPLDFFTPTAGSAGLGVRALPFVGRSRERSALLAAYERSRRGRPEVVIVEGEAGMGKTLLVSQFASSAKQAGADVIAGRALETLAELPYAAVVDGLRARLDEENAPDDLLSDLWLGELARLVPELRERYPDLPTWVDDPALARGRIFEAVARFGQALTQRKPLVFWLDDVQWTDRATRDLVRYVVRRWTEASLPVLVVLAVRRENLSTDWDLGQWLGGLERETPTVWLALDTLERADVVQLVSHLAANPLGVDGADGSQPGTVVEFGTWLTDRTGGHPLSLVHALRRLLEGNVLEVQPIGDGASAIEVPDVAHTEQIKRLDAALLDGQPTLAVERVRYPGEIEPYDLSYRLARGIPYGEDGHAQYQMYRHQGMAVVGRG